MNEKMKDGKRKGETGNSPSYGTGDRILPVSTWVRISNSGPLVLYPHLKSLKGRNNSPIFKGRNTPRDDTFFNDDN